MNGDEPVEKLSEVLTSLQDLGREGLVPKQTMDRQVRTLLEVQDQMLMQLRLHDAQIASLREVIALLSDQNA